MTEMNQQERERLERRREGDRRFFVRLFSFLAGLLVLGLIAVVYVLANNGLGSSEGSNVQPTATEASTNTETQAAPTETQAAIQSGPGAMPANLLTGAQAKQVAAFVAASAGR